jgi:hypothetical protein
VLGFAQRLHAGSVVLVDETEMPRLTAFTHTELDCFIEERKAEKHSSGNRSS